MTHQSALEREMGKTINAIFEQSDYLKAQALILELAVGLATTKRFGDMPSVMDICQMLDLINMRLQNHVRRGDTSKLIEHFQKMWEKSKRETQVVS